MKMKKICTTILLLSMAATPAAYASGFAIGISVGESNLDELADEACDDIITRDTDIFSVAPTCLTDDDDPAYGVNVSYFFTDHLGVEGGYMNLGETSFSTISPLIDVPFGFPAPLETTTFSTNILYGALTGTLPLSERFSITGRAGIYEASIDVEFDDGFRIRDFELESDTDSYFGASLNFEIINDLTLQLRYDDFDVEVTSVGLTYQF